MRGTRAGAALSAFLSCRVADRPPPEVAMGDGLRTIRLVSTDESLIASTRAAAAPIGGWEVEVVSSIDALLDEPPVAGDVLLLDSWMRGGNSYELCRTLTGRSKCR